MTGGLVWIRGGEPIRFNNDATYFCLGVRGSGKSSYLENVAQNYLRKGGGILDLFASRDGESLAWLRSQYAKDTKILLLHGGSVDVKCSFDTKTTDKLTLGDFEKYDIIISSSPCYLDPSDEFENAGKITNLIYRRLSWQRPIFMIAREASSLYYSRLKLTLNQIEAKSQTVYMLREARHSGCALGLDSLRSTAIDIDVRTLADYQILKSQGLGGLPRELWWLYSMFKPYEIQNMPKDKYIMVTKQGNVGVGSFSFPSWHKLPKENMLKVLDITIEYGEVAEEGADKGTFKTIGDDEHAEILRLYIDGQLGMSKIASDIGRSSATVKSHIDAHNAAVKRSGFCPQCRRAKSPLDTGRSDKDRDK
jgi:hypothetical protein